MSKTKKIKKQMQRNVAEESQEVTLNKKEDYINLIKIILSILIFLGLAYVYTRTFITKDWKKEEVQAPETVIDYDSIVAKQALSQAEMEYYVIYTNATSERLFVDYNVNATSKVLLPMYKVDTTELFNEYILVDGEYSKTPENVDEIQIGTLPTLIKVKEGKVVEFIEGDEVEIMLTSLIESANDKE